MHTRDHKSVELVVIAAQAKAPKRHCCRCNGFSDVPVSDLALAARTVYQETLEIAVTPKLPRDGSASCLQPMSPAPSPATNLCPLQCHVPLSPSRSLVGHQPVNRQPILPPELDGQP